MPSLQKENKQLKDDIQDFIKCRDYDAILIKALQEDRKKLKKELDAVRQINMMCMKFMKEIQTEQNLAEMIGLGKDTGTDVAIVHIAKEYIKTNNRHE